MKREIKKQKNKVQYKLKKAIMEKKIENNICKKEKNNINDIGIYIDVPFCKSKCSYCVFPTYVVNNDNNIIDRYFSSLKYEIKNYDKKIIVDDNNSNNILHIDEDIYKMPVSTIYIGGGTPSYINYTYVVEVLNLIYSKFNVLDDAEITVEMNPDDVCKEMLEAFKVSGINRVSLGLQSTNNSILKHAKRRYNFEEFKASISLLKKYFSNISVDIILGLPYETITSFEKTISDISKLDLLKHLSAYEYILDENSLIYNSDELYDNLPNEDDIREMKNIIKREMKKLGYIHYEISNYAKDSNHISKHNYNCWNHKQYIGFGLSSASFLNGYRFVNSRRLNKYIEENSCNTKILNNNKLQTATISHLDENLNIEEYIKDLLFVKLRTANGISYTKIFKELYNYKNNIKDINDIYDIKTTNEENLLITKIAKFLNQNTKENLLVYASTSYNFDDMKIANIYDTTKEKTTKKKMKNIKKKICLNKENNKTYKNIYKYICNPKYIFYGEDSVFPKILLI